MYPLKSVRYTFFRGGDYEFTLLIKIDPENIYLVIKKSDYIS